MSKSITKRVLACILSFCLAFMMIVPAMAETSTLGIEVSASVAGSAAEDINSLLDESKIAVVAGAQDDGSLGMNILLQLMGMEFFKVNAATDGENVSFAFPTVDDKVYAFAAAQMLENLGIMDLLNEIASGSLGGQALPTQEEALEQLANIYVPEISEEELSNMIAPYLEIIMEFVGEGIEVQEDETVVLKELTATSTGELYTWSPSADQLSAVFVKLAEQIAGDETLNKLANELAKTVRSMDGILTSVTAASGEEMSPEEFAEVLEQIVPALPEVLNQISEAIAENGFGEGFGIALNVFSSEDGVSMLDFTIGDDYDKFSFGLESAVVGTAQNAAVYFEAGGERYSAVITDSSADETTPAGSLTIKADGQALLNIAYNFDLTQVSELMAPYGSIVVDFAGMCGASIIVSASEAGTNHMFQVYGLDAFTGSDDISAATLNIATAYNTPLEAPAGETVDITNFSPEQLEELFTGIVGAIAASLGMGAE